MAVVRGARGGEPDRLCALSNLQPGRPARRPPLSRPASRPARRPVIRHSVPTMRAGGCQKASAVGVAPPNMEIVIDDAVDTRPLVP